jgi:hypothetical protein
MIALTLYLDSVDQKRIYYWLNCPGGDVSGEYLGAWLVLQVAVRWAVSCLQPTPSDLLSRPACSTRRLLSLAPAPPAASCTLNTCCPPRVYQTLRLLPLTPPPAPGSRLTSCSHLLPLPPRLPLPTLPYTHTGGPHAGAVRHHAVCAQPHRHGVLRAVPGHGRLPAHRGRGEGGRGRGRGWGWVGGGNGSGWASRGSALALQCSIFRVAALFPLLCTSFPSLPPVPFVTLLSTLPAPPLLPPPPPGLPLRHAPLHPHDAPPQRRVPGPGQRDAH